MGENEPRRARPEGTGKPIASDGPEEVAMAAAPDPAAPDPPGVRASAPAASAPDPASEEKAEDLTELQAKVDDVRATSEEMRDALIDVLDAAERGEVPLRQAVETAATKKNMLKADDVKADFAALLAPIPKERARVRQHATKLISDIRQAQDHWPTTENLTEAPASAELALEELQDIALQAAYMVLSRRIVARLRKSNTADSLVFWDEYKDELATREQGDEVLQWLATLPRSSGILVDAEEGVVYKMPPLKARWALGLMGLWALPFSILAVAAVSWLGDWLITSDDWPLSDTGDVIRLYVCVLIGSALHFLVSLAKNIDFDGELAVTKAGPKLAWLSLRWGSILALYLPPLVTAIALGLTDLRPDDFEGFATLVLAGYSADSLAPVFLSRLGKSADRASKALTRKPKREDDGKEPRKGSRAGGRDEERRRERRRPHERA